VIPPAEDLIIVNPVVRMLSERCNPPGSEHRIAELQAV
jgi:hypothetical protein